MAESDSHSPDEAHDFDDLLGELDQESSFAWDEELESDDEDEQTRPVVSFRIGDDLFSVAGDMVREIIGAPEMTELPGAPDYIRGITVVRRQVVGLLSLRTFLQLQNPSPRVDDDESPTDPGGELSTRRTLIIDTAHFTVGLRVDEVTGLGQWPESQLNPDTLPENMLATTRRYARGARRDGDTLCVYLDLETLLDDAAVQ